MAAEAKYTAAKAVLEQQQQLLVEVVEKNKEATTATSLAEQRQAKAAQDKARSSYEQGDLPYNGLWIIG